MTLQEDTASTDDDTSTDSPTSAPPAKAERVRATYDVGAGQITMQDAAGPRTYTLAGIPDSVRAHLTLVGLHMVLQRANDPAGTLARMQAGHLPGRAPAKSAELPPWRLAYAHAKVEATKKTDAPMSLDDAKAAAAALPAEKLREAKVHPLVVKHFAKLTGASVELV